MTKTFAIKNAGAGGSPSFEGGVVFNEPGNDCDSRVEGENETNLIFVDASKDSIGIGVNPPTAFLHLKAGGSAAGTAPLKIPAGSVLTSPEAGAVEYNGKVFYSTPVAGARGLSPSVMFSIVPAGNFNLALNSNLQPAFPAAADVFTVNADTTYLFEGFYAINKVTGTAQTIAMEFTLGGGASLYHILYNVDFTHTSNALPATLGAPFHLDVATASVTVVTDSRAYIHCFISFNGMLKVNAGGTITPQIKFSAAPDTSAYMYQDSFIKFTPIGSGTVQVIGNIA